MKCHPSLLPSQFLCTEVLYGSSCFTPGPAAWQIFNLFGNNCSNNDYFIGFNYVLKKKCCSSTRRGDALGGGDEDLNPLDVGRAWNGLTVPS